MSVIEDHIHQHQAGQALGLTQLGAVSPLPASPDEAVIETVTFDTALMDGMLVARFTVPEFTSLCPVTGQPDFAEFVIDYIPGTAIIESKSLKLFMGSFRNHAAFHESTTCIVGTRLAQAANPVWMRVVALWYPRGGIPIDVFWQTGEPPKGYHIPPIDYKQFRGR